MGGKMKSCIFFILFVISGASWAACRCVCVNGQSQSVCERAIDLPKTCGAQLCPLPGAALQPLNKPRVPPTGTKRCEPMRILNPDTREYEWRTLCY